MFPGPPKNSLPSFAKLPPPMPYAGSFAPSIYRKPFYTRTRIHDIAKQIDQQTDRQRERERERDRPAGLFERCWDEAAQKEKVCAGARGRGGDRERGRWRVREALCARLGDPLGCSEARFSLSRCSRRNTHAFLFHSFPLAFFVKHCKKKKRKKRERTDQRGLLRESLPRPWREAARRPHSSYRHARLQVDTNATE